MTEKKQPARPAEYGTATPEQVGKAVLTHRPKPKPDATPRQP